MPEMAVSSPGAVIVYRGSLYFPSGPFWEASPEPLLLIITSDYFNYFL